MLIQKRKKSNPLMQLHSASQQLTSLPPPPPQTPASYPQVAFYPEASNTLPQGRFWLHGVEGQGTWGRAGEASQPDAGSNPPGSTNKSIAVAQPHIFLSRRYSQLPYSEGNISQLPPYQIADLCHQREAKSRADAPQPRVPVLETEK